MAIPARRHRTGWLLTALLGGMFLGNVDIAIVNIAAPSVREHLHASGGELELIVSGYTLAYAMLLITGARLGDIYGRRRMFLLGLAVFTLASLACGLAADAAGLVAARVAQGVGAALLVSQVLTAIQLHFTGAARTRALGVYTAVLAGSAVLGQVLGGLLVSADLFGLAWRPVFLVNVPLGAALLLLSARCLPADRPARRQRLDLPGVGLLSLALLLVVTPLVLGRDAGWPAWTWLSLGAGLVLLAVFLVVERRVAASDGNPLITVSLLARRPVALALASQAATRATYFALLFVLALYLQEELRAGPMYSGLMLVSWVAAFGVAGPLLGRVSARVRRLAAPVGTLLVAVSFTGIAVGEAFGPAGTTWLVLALGVGGLGYGAAFSGTLTHLTSAVTDRHAADISGLFNTTLQVGGALGVAVFGTLYFELAEGPGQARSAFVVTMAALALTAVLAAHLIRSATTPAGRLTPAGSRDPGVTVSAARGGGPVPGR